MRHHAASLPLKSSKSVKSGVRFSSAGCHQPCVRYRHICARSMESGDSERVKSLPLPLYIRQKPPIDRNSSPLSHLNVGLDRAEAFLLQKAVSFLEVFLPLYIVIRKKEGKNEHFSCDFRKSLYFMANNEVKGSWVRGFMVRDREV